MDTIGIVDYECGIDRKGFPTGHTNKVINEYGLLIEDFVKPIIFASKSVLKKAEVNYEMFELPYENVLRITNNILYKIRFRVNLWKNLRVVFKQNQVETLWFINTNSFLYVYLFFCGKNNKKIICTMYRDNYGKHGFSRLSNILFELMVSKIDLIVSSNQKFVFRNNNVFFMPDYYYSQSTYEKYNNNKKWRIVCLGTVDRRKKILDILPYLNNSGIEVIIAGTFIDKEYEIAIKKLSATNVKIINEYLEYDEYYTLLGESQFCILPYNLDVYSERTSGVLQEAIFLDTIPISYKRLLEYNDIDGIFIESIIDEGITKVLAGVDLKKYVSKYKEYRNKRFDFCTNKKRLKEKIMEMLPIA